MACSYRSVVELLSRPNFQHHRLNKHDSFPQGRKAVRFSLIAPLSIYYCVVVTIIIFLFFSAGDGAQGLVYAKQVNTTRLHFQSKAILFFVFLYDVFWEGVLGAQTGLELEIFLSLSLQSAGIELLSTAHHCAWFQFCVLLF